MHDGTGSGLDNLGPGDIITMPQEGMPQLGGAIEQNWHRYTMAIADTLEELEQHIQDNGLILPPDPDDYPTDNIQ
jgi:hypothetical protein